MLYSVHVGTFENEIEHFQIYYTCVLSRAENALRNMLYKAVIKKPDDVDFCFIISEEKNKIIKKDYQKIIKAVCDFKKIWGKKSAPYLYEDIFNSPYYHTYNDNKINPDSFYYQQIKKFRPDKQLKLEV